MQDDDVLGLVLEASLLNGQEGKIKVYVVNGLKTGGRNKVKDFFIRLLFLLVILLIFRIGEQTEENPGVSSVHYSAEGKKDF